MKRYFLLVVALVALMAAPASASVQNIKVSGELYSAHVLRHDFNFGSNAGVKTDANVFATVAKLGVEADLSDNVSATIGLISERAWGDETATNTDIDLDVAYVTLREMLYSPLTVQIGRQVLSYGNEFLIGNSPSGTTAGQGITGTAVGDLSFKDATDAIKLVFDYDPLTIDLFYSKIDDGLSSISSNAGTSDDIDLFGVNANYQLGDSMGTELEAYFFGKIDRQPNYNGDPATIDEKDDTMYVPGARLSTNVTEDLNVQAEFAYQTGTKVLNNIANRSRDAYAFQGFVNFALPVIEDYSPVLSASYSYFSGDANATTGTGDYEAWDELYENQDEGRIHDALFDKSNAHYFTLAGEIVPMEDLTAKLSWTGIWLAEEFNAGDTITLNQPDGTTVNANATNDDELGHEFDLDLSYDYTEDVNFGVSAGLFFAGDAFQDPSGTVSQVLTSVSVAF